MLTLILQFRRGTCALGVFALPQSPFAAILPCGSLQNGVVCSCTRWWEWGMHWAGDACCAGVALGLVHQHVEHYKTHSSS